MAMNGNRAGAAPAEEAAMNGNGAAEHDVGGDVVILPEDVAEWLKVENNRTALYEYLIGADAKCLTSEILKLMSRNQIKWVMKTLDQQTQWKTVRDIVNGLPIHNQLSKQVIDEILKNAAPTPLHDQLSKLVIEEILKNEVDPLKTLTAAVENLHSIRHYVGQKEYYHPNDNNGPEIELPIKGPILGPNQVGELLLKGNLRSMRRTAAFLVACLFQTRAAVSTEKRQVTKFLYRMGLSVTDVEDILRKLSVLAPRFRVSNSLCNLFLRICVRL